MSIYKPSDAPFLDPHLILYRPSDDPLQTFIWLFTDPQLTLYKPSDDPSLSLSLRAHATEKIYNTFGHGFLNSFKVGGHEQYF